MQTITPEPPLKRIQSIDILRGIVMVIMALDHTRDFFSSFNYEPTNLQHASTAMFLTRWITHFCAPVFVFFSGASAFLSQGKGKTTKQASFHLFTRGLWMILMEFTVVRIGWALNLDYSHVYLQVIWAIGCSMILLSLLIFLPRPVILALGLIMVFGHDMLDGIKADSLGSSANLWRLLHEQGPIKFDQNNSVFILYPLIPWIGLMPLGYCFGSIFRMPEQQRNKWLYGIGISAIVLFILLRLINNYGDPSPWHAQYTWRRTVLSFLNCSKYPPSLLYLLMTLGPAITVLPFLENRSNAAERFFTIYGRVPFFYYILHLYLIHCTAVVTELILKGKAEGVTIFNHPGYPLGSVYLFWMAIVLTLYFPCKWFMKIKLAHKKWWLSYI